DLECVSQPKLYLSAASIWMPTFGQLSEMLIHTSSGESVFKDVNSLHPDYIPPEILFRGRELNKLRFLREGLLYKPANYRRVFITGGRGQGKTLLTRFFARENSETQKGLYVDCLECKGKVTLILHRIIGWFKPGFPSGGYSLEELKSILTTIFEDRREKVLQTSSSTIVVLGIGKLYRKL
ncbi:MAG: hypothetical protein QXL67_05550, partial [Candidatus Bathyarchaeia archaeon]